MNGQALGEGLCPGEGRSLLLVSSVGREEATSGVSPYKAINPILRPKL